MEDKEQVLETTIQKTTTEEDTATVENKEVETNVNEESKKEEEWVAPTKEEFEKQLKSAASKAKYEILKELGIESVQSFKDKEKDRESKYETAIKESEDVKKENSRLKDEINIRDLNVAEEYRDDFLTLVKSKISDTKDFKTAGQEVLEKNPSWRSTSKVVKLGTEKSEQSESDVYDVLSKKYPWMKR